MEKEICIYIDCKNKIKRGFEDYCDFHYSGGSFGNGETYEQYQLIEQDFINFIKVIPLNDEYHLKVHSPVLRDIILRSCTQIEIFLKEWGKYFILKEIDSKLYKSYYKLDKTTEKPRGVKNWTFGNYFEIKRDSFSTQRKVYVSPLDKEIEPFQDWESAKNIPFWWNAYNSIKHNGLESKKDANLKNALYSLAALFQLHCENGYSNLFLKKYVSFNVQKFLGKVKIKHHNISSPIDSKRYLFRDTINNHNEFSLVTMKTFNERNKKKIF